MIDDRRNGPACSHPNLDPRTLGAVSGRECGGQGLGGCRLVTQTLTPALWEQYQAEFPVRERLIYLNHAGVTPLCRAAAAAMKKLTNDALEFGSLHYDE